MKTLYRLRSENLNNKLQRYCPKSQSAQLEAEP